MSLVIGLGLASAVWAANETQAAYAPVRTILRFSTMYAVDGPFVGDENKIRDIPGDDLPWDIASADGTLLSDGSLSITVRKLVFTQDDVVPPNLRGINDEEQFRAVVSCLTEDNDQVTTANVVTQGFRASRSGDSKIDARLKLPNPCVAPIIFIVSGDELDWLAVTGSEN